MPVYRIEVDFVFSTTVEFEAPSPSIAEMMVLQANNDQIAHLNGRSYALASDTTRIVKSITEVV